MRSPTTLIHACVLVLLATNHYASAHPFHISSAEVEYDPQTDRLQISLKMQAIDIERALAQLTGGSIKLEDEGVEPWLVQYVSCHFYLTPLPTAVDQQPQNATAMPREDTPVRPRQTPPDSLSRVHWVGRELKGAWLWLYFELELPASRRHSTDAKLSRDDLLLVNTTLCEYNSGQINTVSVRHAGQRTALKMTSQQPSEKFLSLWMTP